MRAPGGLRATGRTLSGALT